MRKNECEGRGADYRIEYAVSFQFWLKKDTL